MREAPAAQDACPRNLMEAENLLGGASGGDARGAAKGAQPHNRPHLMGNVITSGKEAG